MLLWSKKSDIAEAIRDMISPDWTCKQHPYLNENNRISGVYFWCPIFGYIPGVLYTRCPICGAWCDNLNYNACLYVVSACLTVLSYMFFFFSGFVSGMRIFPFSTICTAATIGLNLPFDPAITHVRRPLHPRATSERLFCRTEFWLSPDFFGKMPNFPFFAIPPSQ